MARTLTTDIRSVPYSQVPGHQPELYHCGFSLGSLRRDRGATLRCLSAVQMRGRRPVGQAWKHDRAQLLCEVIPLPSESPLTTLSTLTKSLTSYVDLFLSTKEGNPAYFGNLSIVVHASDKARLSCANFTLQGTHSGPGSSGAGSAPRSSPVSSPPAVVTAGPPTVNRPPPPPPPASSSSPPV